MFLKTLGFSEDGYKPASYPWTLFNHTSDLWQTSITAERNSEHRHHNITQSRPVVSALQGCWDTDAVCARVCLLSCVKLFAGQCKVVTSKCCRTYADEADDCNESGFAWCVWCVCVWARTCVCLFVRYRPQYLWMVLCSCSFFVLNTCWIFLCVSDLS